MENSRWMDFIKDNFKTIIEIFSIFMVVVSIISIKNYFIEKEQERKEILSIQQKWYDQLPEDDLFKQNSKNNLTDRTLLEMRDFLKSSADTSIGLSVKSTKLSDSKAVKTLGAALEKQEKHRKSLYILKNKNKKIKRIHLNKDKEMVVDFFRGNQLIDLKLEIKSDKDLENFTNDFNNFAPSCIENTEIATIYNGVIEAKNPGKTELKICVDGRPFSYPIIVD